MKVKPAIIVAVLTAFITTIVWIDRGGSHAGAAETAAPWSTPAYDAARALSDAFAQATQKVKPAVVSIIATKYVTMKRNELPFEFFGNPFDDNGSSRRHSMTPRKFKQQGLGSGVIIDKDGYILTNNHVVEGESELKVFLADKRELSAKVVGTDPSTDLAVIKVTGGDLPYASLGDSEQLRIGEWVIAIGSPYGLPQTVTAGIVSAKGRQGVLDGKGYEDFIQTDAAINHGNSGGPLINLKGEVVGINTAIYSENGGNAGIGFSVPTTIIHRVLPSLRAGKPVVRGQLGVVIQELNDELAKQFDLKENSGVVVAQVTKDSAAERAGIQPGDVITKFNGEVVVGVNELRNRVAATEPGKKVPVVVIRKGHEVSLTATLGQAGNETASSGGEGESAETKLGFQVANLTAEEAKHLGYAEEKGVVVTEVDRDSLAYERGIREGDLIMEVNQKPVENVKDFEKATATKKPSVLLLVKNRNGSRFIAVPKK